MLYYDNVLKGVEAFKGQSIQLTEISIEWLKRYEKFLLTDKNHTTVSLHMQASFEKEERLKNTVLLTRFDQPDSATVETPQNSPGK